MLCYVSNMAGVMDRDVGRAVEKGGGRGVGGESYGLKHVPANHPPSLTGRRRYTCTY